MERHRPSGRDRLVAAARQLFAEHGIDAVSLREIARVAGQRNPNAVQYHFGDRDTLLSAVLEPHHVQVAARRASLLDELDATPGASTRVLAAALVRPSAAMLEEPGGAEYLRIMAGLIRDPAQMRTRGAAIDAELLRWDRIAKQRMPEETLPLHRRFSAIQLCFNELGRRATLRRPPDHQLFVSDLIDLVAGLLDAPVSADTLDLLARRDSDRAAAAGGRR